MRKLTRALLIVLGIAVVIEIVETSFMVWACRTRNPRALRRIRTINKQMTNPLVLRFSGGEGSSTGVLHHVGRRSGREYATPLLAHRSGDHVVIPLPYGTEVDWLRNLLASGHATIDLDGRTLALEDPIVVGMTEVTDMLSAMQIRAQRLYRTRYAARARAIEIHGAATA